MTISDSQRERLPKAVRQYIESLESSVDYYKKKVITGPENSLVFADGVVGGDDTPLGTTRRIYFRPNGTKDRRDDAEITVYLDSDGSLIVNAHGTLQVTPWAANMVKLRSVGRF